MNTLQNILLKQSAEFYQSFFHAESYQIIDNYIVLANCILEEDLGSAKGGKHEQISIPIVINFETFGGDSMGSFYNEDTC